ncbi:MAG: IS21 family transposase [bacterium]
METIRKIRMAFKRDGKSIRQIARDFNLSRNTVKKVLRDDTIELCYTRSKQSLPKLGAYVDALTNRLQAEAGLPRRERSTALVIFEELQRAGFDGGYDSVRRYVQRWRREQQKLPVNAFIPQQFAAGEAYQFDWSYEKVEIGGVLIKVKMAHFRLCHSRKFFCVAYQRESVEMVLDAHIRAFAFFGGSCRRGIYDNLKTVVTKVMQGKDRLFNRRFLLLASHYLIEPVACTPAAGWEKGQVENQVCFIRNRLFIPRPKFASIAEMNEWLYCQCERLAVTQEHPEFKGRTVAEVFAEEKPYLLTVSTPFEGYRESPVRVSSTALVNYDTNRYSVAAASAGKTVMLRAYAERIVIMQDNRIIGEHPRSFERHQVCYNPWHYLPVLQRKPGALRNGAPFQDWQLPAPIVAMREALSRHADGSRQFVNILSMIPTYGLDAVEVACDETLAIGSASSDVVLNILCRLHDDPAVAAGETVPGLPQLKTPPCADCHRYDSFLSRGGDYAA